MCPNCQSEPHCERLSLNPKEWWQKHEEQAEKHRKAGIADPALAEFRWMLEELQVSLFAQELRTPYPISFKRLEKAWEGIKP